MHELKDENANDIIAYQPDKPIYIGEFWAVRSQQWGGYFKRQTPQEVAEKYDSMLKRGAYVNFYMFCGGTNYGFYNGALFNRYAVDAITAPNRYIPFATSYDVDALVTEFGEPTDKYYACKKVLVDYLNGTEFKNQSKAETSYTSN